MNAEKQTLADQIRDKSHRLTAKFLIENNAVPVAFVFPDNSLIDFRPTYNSCLNLFESLGDEQKKIRDGEDSDE